jgi:glyoxylase-like metal-dependent hydrolase (beta-lactamase superfamily II)
MSAPFRVIDSIYMVGSSEISDSMDCCVYLVDAGELVLIDTGAGKSAGRLADNIQAMGLMPEKLSTIVITHAHIDHIGSLYDLKAKYNARVIAHEADAQAIESGKKVGAEYYGVKYRPCIVDIKLQGESSNLKIGSLEFQFLHIPGHTPGSVAVVLNNIEGQKILFGQDIHGPYQPMWGGEPQKAIKSLEKLREIRADILCEGHYGVITPAQAVNEFISDFIDGLKSR